jgi:hypothetical protein
MTSSLGGSQNVGLSLVVSQSSVAFAKHVVEFPCDQAQAKAQACSVSPVVGYMKKAGPGGGSKMRRTDIFPQKKKLLPANREGLFASNAQKIAGGQ